MLVGISNVRIYREREKCAACDAKKVELLGMMVDTWRKCLSECCGG